MKEVEEDGGESIILEGYRINGYIYDQKHCPTCDSPSIYAYDFDALFCSKCNLWLESACSDPSYEFCRERPLRPLS